MTETASTTVRDPYATWLPEFATMFTDGKPDVLMVPLVEALRAKGLTTFGSCQGHGTDECVRDHDQRGSICQHPGQLSIDARTLDPVSALRIEGSVFTQIACFTYPRFVWTFRWDAADRDEAIGRLSMLEVAEISEPSIATEPK